MKLKVCGIADPENLSRLIELKPDYTGFIFYPLSKRYMGDDAALMRYISTISGTLKVGVFVNADADEIQARVEAYRLDLIQLHGNESPAFCQQIAAFVPVIKAFGIDADFDFGLLQAYQNYCDHFLFDTATTQYGGSGIAFDWTLLNRYQLDTPFLLSGGINLGHAPAIKSIAHPALAGIDVNSGFEISPGIKNISTLKTFFNDIRN